MKNVKLSLSLDSKDQFQEAFKKYPPQFNFSPPQTVIPIMKTKSSISKNLPNPLICVIRDSDSSAIKALKGRYTIAMGVSPS